MKTKLWYRCAMCSPNQSTFVEIDTENPSVAEAYRLVMEHHKEVAPGCMLAAGFDPASTVVSVEFLLRPIQ